MTNQHEPRHSAAPALLLAFGAAIALAAAASTADRRADDTTAALETLDREARGGYDLNRASERTLASLPGLGPVLARRIVAFREHVGPFEAVDDLMLIPGVGRHRYSEIRAWLCTRPPWTR